MMTVLKERRREYEVARDVDGAGEIDTLMAQISDFFLENELYTSKAEKVALIQRQYEIEKGRLDSLEAHWKREIKKFTDKRDREHRRLHCTSQTRVKKHDQSIPAVLPPEHARLSSELLDLRDREKHLIISRSFTEASKLHREYLARQEQELQKRREEYFQRHEKIRSDIQYRNDQRGFAFDNHWNVKLDELRDKMNAELVPLRKSVSNLLYKVLAAKAEYVGEDDTILKTDPALDDARTVGNIYRVSQPAFTKGLVPLTLAKSNRPLTRPTPVMSVAQMAEATFRQSRGWRD
jgi:vacuolar-type H+-ATPase subunit H